MKEEDIDKIFRDALADQKSPTTESDWEDFEGMLNSHKAGLSYRWITLFVLLLLIGGSLGAYYLNSEPQVKYISRAQPSENVLDNESKKDLSELNFSALDTGAKNSARQSDDHNELAQGISDSTYTSAEKDAQKQKLGFSPKEETGTILQQSINDDVKASNQSRDSEKTDGSKIQQTALKIEMNERKNTLPAPVKTLGPNKETGTSDERVLKRDNQSGFATSQSSKINNPSRKELLPSTDAELVKPETIPLIGTELNANVSAVLKGEKRKIEPLNQQYFIPFIYFKLEQNNVFKTSPALGIGLQRNFPLQGKGAISVQGALGYQRTGRLAWEQTSETVTYGFDRYAEESNLKTNNLGMIQIPIRVAYQAGVHSIFVGAEMNWVITASQEFRPMAEGEVDQGYLYDSGAPNSALFFQLGYGYVLNEKLQLDLGINAAGMDWEPADKRPIGGFMRLKYFIR
ncbi:MAG: hypothetical protein ABR574_12370 [Cryomorphaceae bacterium]